MVLGLVAAGVVTSLCATAQAEPPPPQCRLDADKSKAVELTLQLAVDAYQTLGKKLAVDQITVNPKSRSGTARTLTAYIVSDASIGLTDKLGCFVGSRRMVKGDQLDAISVRGGCIAVAGGAPEIRCSSEAVSTFGGVGDRPSKQNPALLYVLAHELGHILQRRSGEYAGRVELIDLKNTQASKLETLRDACEPGLVKAEEDADRLAVQVLSKLLPVTPYREPLFSERGSVLWGIDQINLAANKWRAAALEREFISQPKPHQSFIPKEFPTPASIIESNASNFVCDVLMKRNGTVPYPGKASSHPALEVRMQRVAEALRPVAARLPETVTQHDYKPITVLQQQLSDIFTFMYRETGAYHQALQSAICTKVNSEKPSADCSVTR